MPLATMAAMIRVFRASLLSGLLVAATAIAACTTPSGSGVLSVSNESDERVYVRIDADPGQVAIYRVDPGAVGRAEAVGAGGRPTTLTIYSADCTLISEQSDPALGQLQIETSSMVFTAAPDPDVASKPLLPRDDTCR
jgi:hypothetical protein